MKLQLVTLLSVFLVFSVQADPPVENPLNALNNLVKSLTEQMRTLTSTSTRLSEVFNKAISSSVRVATNNASTQQITDQMSNLAKTISTATRSLTDMSSEINRAITSSTRILGGGSDSLRRKRQLPGVDIATWEKNLSEALNTFSTQVRTFSDYASTAFRNMRLSEQARTLTDSFQGFLRSLNTLQRLLPSGGGSASASTEPTF